MANAFLGVKVPGKPSKVKVHLKEAKAIARRLRVEVEDGKLPPDVKLYGRNRNSTDEEAAAPQQRVERIQEAFESGSGLGSSVLAAQKRRKRSAKERPRRDWRSLKKTTENRYWLCREISCFDEELGAETV